MYFFKKDPDFWGKGPKSSAHAREVAEAVGIKVRHFVMSDQDMDAEGSPKPPVAALMYQPPGHCLPRHRHSSHRLEFIIEGSLEVDGRVLGPGDVMWSEAGEFYGPHVAGPQGVLTVEVFSSTEGVGGEMEDPSLDTKTFLKELQGGDMTPEERQQAIQTYAERMRSYRPSPAS